MTGSGEDRSIQELVNIMSWPKLSVGPSGVSRLSSAGIKGSGCDWDSERVWVYELRRLRTRVWKWSFVTELVSMSY
jgi:hypothetical protein